MNDKKSPFEDKKTPDRPTKKIYHKPSVQIYGTLAQMTEFTFNTGRRSDSPGGIPASRRT